MTRTHRLHRGGRRGFTLAELMIIVVIIGIVLAFALPRFAGYLRYLTTRSTTSLVVADLSLARTQAAREGAPVSFRVVSSSRYQVTVDDAAGNPVRTIKTVDVQGPQKSAVTLAPTGSRVGFDSRGMRRTNIETIVVQRGSQTDSISISIVGRVYRVR
jgi:prepilin-type N-terminal cleavage/methylation domain-containing protein